MARSGSARALRLPKDFLQKIFPAAKYFLNGQLSWLKDECVSPLVRRQPGRGPRMGDGENEEVKWKMDAVMLVRMPRPVVPA
jgi:hypothetical protein